MGAACSRCFGLRNDDDAKPGERQPLLGNEHPPITFQPTAHRNLQDSIHEEESLKQIVDRTRANTINIKELNAQSTSITNIDFGERSLKYQQLVKTIKAPNPVTPPEQISVADDEREWMLRVGKDVNDALGSMKVKDVGQVVVGFDL